MSQINKINKLFTKSKQVSNGFISKLLRISKKDFGEREKIIYFFVVSLFLILLMIVGSSLNFLFSFNVEEQRRSSIINMIVLCSSAILIVFGIISFLIFRSFQLYFFIVSLALVFALQGIHILEHLQVTGGILSGSPIGVIQVLIVFVFTFSGNFFQIMISFFFVITCLTVSMIIDMAWGDATGYFSQIAEHLAEGNTFRMVSVYIYVYMPYYFNILIIMVVLMIQRRKNRRTEKVIDELGDSILSLNFENKDIIKLEKAEIKNLTKNEILFHNMIKNLKIYSQFLPDTITKQEFNNSSYALERTDSNYSESSDSSTKENSSLEKPSSIPVYSLDSKISKVSSNSSQGSNKDNINGNKGKKRDITFGFEKRKDIVVMLIESRIFQKYDTRKPNSSEIINEKIIQFSNIVCAKVYDNNGMVHSNNGTSILVTFNAQKIVVNPSRRAADCAFQIIQQFKRLLKTISPIISIIKAKKMINGIIKNNYHSKYHLISPRIGLLYSFVHQSKNYQKEESIYVDQGVEKDLKYRYYCKKINKVPFTMHNDLEMESIYRLVKKEERNGNDVENEWFYKVDVQKKNVNGNDKNTMINLFNSCWEEMEQENFEKAKNLLDEYDKNMAVKFTGKDVDSEFLRKKLETHFLNQPLKE